MPSRIGWFRNCYGCFHSINGMAGNSDGCRLCLETPEETGRRFAKETIAKIREEYR